MCDAAPSGKTSSPPRWFASGFPQDDPITYAQLYSLLTKWRKATALLPPSLRLIVSVSDSNPLFWIAALSKRKASDLVGNIKRGSCRPLTEELDRILLRRQSERWRTLSDVADKCPRCSTLWPRKATEIVPWLHRKNINDVDIQQVSGLDNMEAANVDSLTLIYLECPSCREPVILGGLLAWKRNLVGLPFESVRRK